MALLIQTLVLLSSLQFTSWDSGSTSQYIQRQEEFRPIKIVDIAPHQVTSSRRSPSAQQQRIQQMGANGVIYADAPPTISRRRILR